MNNSMIAKLLAKENITVEHGNFRTAFFDVEKRILGLPLWKDMGKDVYDLLVGHEVGHALETPAEGWHDSVKNLGVPRAYINIVEDIRIEKLIQRSYPGLVGSFKRGYKVLNDSDFFGISDKYVNGLHLADRINLKSKLRDLIDVSFSDKEIAVVNQCFAVETWDEVLDACRALYNFIEENKDEHKPTHAVEIAVPNDDGDDIVQSTDSSGQSDRQTSEQLSTDEPTGYSNSDSESESFAEENSSNAKDGPVTEQSEETPEEVSTGDSGAGSNVSINPHEPITDTVFRDKEKSLVDVDRRGNQPTIVKGITRTQASEMINEYELVEEKRKEFNRIYAPVEFNRQLNEFNEDTKKFVSVMAKEFEMRKMAYRTKRSQTSRSGSLDLSKLHSYKYNDDIFNKVTRLADAKSHGMVMFIDFSGSMHNVIGDTVRQTLILASFCKKVNIPFEVYSFTTGASLKPRSKDTGLIPTFNISEINVNQLLSSSMKKSTYLNAYKDLFAISSRGCATVWDNLGGTPLNETVMAARFVLADFKARTQVQKVNAIFLTDGEAQSMYIDNKEDQVDSENTIAHSDSWKRTIMLDGKKIEASRSENFKLTSNLLETLRKEYNVIGYFLAARAYEMRDRVWKASGSYVDIKKMNEIRKEYNKNKFVSFNDVLGYDNFFIIKAEGRSLATDDDEFEVSENAGKGEIQRAFKKHANSKKTNKLFATQFAKMVA